jgi:hypothetical protein
MVAAVFLDLLRRPLHAPVGDGSDHDRGIGGEGGVDRGGHIACRLYINACHARRGVECHGASDQRNPRTLGCKCGGYGETLFARGAICDVADGIDRLMRRSGGDDDVHTTP